MARDPWDRFFRDFDEEFESMRSMFDELLRQAQDAQASMGTDPFVYGFTLRMGPDGKPHLEPFGNRPPTEARVTTDDARDRTPLTDVLAGETEVSITMELPGVAKQDINLRVTEDRVVLSVDTASRRYHKEVDLPVKVKPESAEATYKNGILDLSLKRAEPPHDDGTRVEVR